MHTFLSAVMLACCGIGILCPLGHAIAGRGGVLRNAGQWGPMALMLAAMADTSLGPGLVPGVAWGLLLLLAAPLPLVLRRREHRDGMEFHRALSVLGMFALLVTGLQVVPGGVPHGHAHPGTAGFTPFLAVALAAVVAGYSVVLAVRALRSRRLFHPAEAFSSAGALGAMILMTL